LLKSYLENFPFFLYTTSIFLSKNPVLRINIKMFFPRFSRIYFGVCLIFVLFFPGCASTTLPKTIPSPLAVPVEEPVGESPEPQALEPEVVLFDEGMPPPGDNVMEEGEPMMVPFGTVFAKTVFEGVVKTSYVQLTIVDFIDPNKVFQLIIGDKARQKNLPWNIQTVKPGYFFITLPVGHYRINSITIPVGTTLATEPMDVSFDVEFDKTIYLGTLKVIGEKERIKLGGVPIIKPGFEYTLQILDERTEAQKEFSRRFPEHGGRIDYQLMEVNAFNNNRLLPSAGDS